MQCHLLTESRLAFEKAYKTAQVMETADHDARELQGLAAAAVNKVNRTTNAAGATRNPLPADAKPENNRNNQVTVTTAEGNIADWIAGSVNWSAGSARK